MDEQYRKELEAVVAANRAALARGDAGYWRKTRAQRPGTRAETDTGKPSMQMAEDPFTKFLREVRESYQPGALKTHMLAVLKREGRWRD